VEADKVSHFVWNGIIVDVIPGAVLHHVSIDAEVKARSAASPASDSTLQVKSNFNLGQQDIVFLVG
jgi:hypothetical protein